MIGAPLEPGTRVLLRMPDWLGDFVMAEPAVRALAAHVGPSNLSVAGSEHLLALLTGGSAEARRIPHAPGTRGTAADWRGHDVALLLTGSFRSAWTAVRAGIGRRVGWARDARALLLTDGFRPPLERGAVPLGLGRAGRRPRILPRPFPAAVSDLLGFVGVRVLDPHPRIEVEEGIEVELAARLEGLGLARTQPFLAANVGSRPGSAKGYPHGSFARAIERVRAETGLATVLVAGPGEEESVREVEARLGPGPAVIGAV
ncbi:MAG TPA: lipopolysaccharide heptosyltransferase family protein, partial [Planctomycetes bacterium]|nr:lipopolysaccharide heptosyltransferase family protein [Planctomycetota bacterium]